MPLQILPAFNYYYFFSAHREFCYIICTVLQCGLRPLRPQCGKYPAENRTRDGRSKGRDTDHWTIALPFKKLCLCSHRSLLITMLTVERKSCVILSLTQPPHSCVTFSLNRPPHSCVIISLAERFMLMRLCIQIFIVGHNFR